MYVLFCTCMNCVGNLTWLTRGLNETHDVMCRVIMFRLALGTVLLFTCSCQ